MKRKTLKQLDREADEREMYLPWSKENLTPDQRARLEKEEEERRALENTPEGRQLLEDGWNEFIVNWPHWQKLKTLSPKQFCILRHGHDPQKFEVEREYFPDGEEPSLGDRVEADLQILEGDPEMGVVERRTVAEWVAWTTAAGLTCPHFLLKAAVAHSVKARHEKSPSANKPGITPSKFIARHASRVNGGKSYLMKWFYGKSRRKGEKRPAMDFHISWGRYDEQRMVAQLKREGRYRDVGD